MQVGIVGAGSIGCFVGGRLLAAETADVTFVGRPRVAEEIREHGLTVRDTGGDEARVPPERVDFVTAIDALPTCDAVLVCVKSAQTEGVARELAEVLGPQTLVVSLQNGMGNARILREHLGERPVAAAVVGFNVVSMGDGAFHRGMSGPLMIEDLGVPACSALARALRTSGVQVDLDADVAPHQWTKLLVNLNNSISALSGAPTAGLLSDAGYRHIVADIIDEGVSVLKAAGIRPAKLRGVPVAWMPRVLRLPTPLVRLVTRAQVRVDPHARSSMWEDLQRDRTTEVEFLNGEIVRLAERSGTDAPLNRRVCDLVHDAERASSGSPELSAEALRTALHAP